MLEFATYEASYCSLRDIGLEVLYYNKDMFDAAGLSYPDDTWTWDDLLAASEALAIVDGDRVDLCTLGMEAANISFGWSQNGGAILDDMRNPSKCTLIRLAASVLRRYDEQQCVCARPSARPGRWRCRMSPGRSRHDHPEL
ncbi:MAG: extracellular solute-binding protein [Caldilineaceae bacterium]